MESDKVEIANKIFDLARLQIVPIDSVRPNTWNPKDKDTQEYESVKESIKVNGLRGFIVVREKAGATPEDVYEIIDGEQRWCSCKELGFTEIYIYNEGAINDRQARELTLWWQIQVPFNDFLLAKLITDMTDQYGEIISPYSLEKIEEMRELIKHSINNYNPNTPPPPQGSLLKLFSIPLTLPQYTIVQRAMDKARERSGSDTGDGVLVDMISTDYLRGMES